MYALLDAFVVPRRDERAARLVTPLKPFEAMAMARPLIVADLPALTEIAPDGERSLAYRPEDADGAGGGRGPADGPPGPRRAAWRGGAGMGDARAHLGVQRPALDRDLRGRAGRTPRPTVARGRVVNLVPRGIATDAASAALATTAALRTLEAAGVAAPAVWVAHGTAKFDSTAAWDHGIALVRVDGPEAEAAALGVVRAVGARVVRAATDLGQRRVRPRGDGAWLAARYELGLWPDEKVDVVMGADRHPAALADAPRAHSTRSSPTSPGLRDDSCWPR